jgi:hypothetical protein
MLSSRISASGGRRRCAGPPPKKEITQGQWAVVNGGSRGGALARIRPPAPTLERGAHVGRHSRWDSVARDKVLKRKEGRSPGLGVWVDVDTQSEIGVKAGRAAPRHGNIGPAKRGFQCSGAACWDPNRFGWCKMCGGDAPKGE